MTQAAFPQWWKEGVRVVRADGTVGTVIRGQEQEWIILVGGSYILHPDPAKWGYGDQILTPTQLRRIVYDADKALCQAFGCGGLTEWMSLPDSVRIEGDVRPAPLNRPELDGLRSVLVAAIRQAMAQFVK